MPSLHQPLAFATDDVGQTHSRWTIHGSLHKLTDHDHGRGEQSPLPLSRTEKAPKERRVLRKKPTLTFTSMPTAWNANTPNFQFSSKVHTPTAAPRHPWAGPALSSAPALVTVPAAPELKFPILPRKASNVPLWLNRPVAKPSRATLRPEPESEPSPPSPVQSNNTRNSLVSTVDPTSSAADVEKADASRRTSSLSTAPSSSTRTLSIIDGVFSGIWKEDFHPSPFSRRPSNSPSVTTSHSRFSSRRSSSTPPSSISGTITSSTPVASTPSRSKFVEALPSSAPEDREASVQDHQAAPPCLKRPTRTTSQQSNDTGKGQPICTDYDYIQAVNTLLETPSPSQSAPVPQNLGHPRSELRSPSMSSRQQSTDSFDSLTSWQCVSGIPDDADRAQRGRPRRKLKKRCAAQGSTPPAKAKPSLFSSALFSHSASAR
ncbi:hypothetical protein D9619_006610 [Psilocybe cf. subviscida]|uniref:Uncharacterized protein n=1 Tax=Psilocybe cf. subviscida TaxID=2480587 RepID=A0A8H5B4H8_9AGAR|nr:hypothetical protein D9619_006610 [Psilocybe cf. subviscida]